MSWLLRGGGSSLTYSLLAPYFGSRAFSQDENQDSLSQLLGFVRDDNEVAEYCQRDFVTLTGELEELDQLINLLRQTAEDFMGLVNCPTVVPLYTSSGTWQNEMQVMVEAVGFTYSHYCARLLVLILQYTTPLVPIRPNPYSGCTWVPFSLRSLALS